MTIYDDGNIFCPPNRSGYHINIGHPLIYPLYVAFCRKINNPLHYPLSDKQRFEFETSVLKFIEKKKSE